MESGRVKIVCEDGFESVTTTRKELVDRVQWHGQHADQRRMSEEEALKTSRHS